MSTPFPSGPGSAVPGAASPGDPGGAVVVPASVVNQWASTFTQPVAFGTTPPALQSLVIPLNSSTNVGSGSGTPTAGNWLVVITGMNEQATTSGFTVGDADDIHSYWRPAKVSTSAALTRTSVWYTANTARVPADVYIAPNGAFDGLAALVLEVSGLGPWDVITVSASNYAAAATTLNLATAAPSAASFMLAAVVGDNDSVSQAFAPGGWTGLHTVTATNGTNHVSDVVLTSAFLATNSSSVSVNGTASTSDLSGVIIGIELAAPSPIPSSSGVSPGWAGRTILQAALGSGFQTPGDEMVWTTLNDSSLTPAQEPGKCFWSWTETSTGIPYALGQLQSTEGSLTLDNATGTFTPSNAAGTYYPDVTTGTPLRLLFALGTVGGVAVNRWYVWQRNALDWVEKRDGESLRNYVETGLTDGWSVAAANCPSPWRGEILQDGPYAWWPCNDLPGDSGVLPVQLLNAAPGNSNVMQIIASASGVSAASPYGLPGGETFGAGGDNSLASVATYTTGADAGWTYGDPQSSPASYSTGNPVTASPGSASWQQTGLTGSGGANTWYLACNDASFPPLSGGVTVKGSFSLPFFSTSTTLHYTPTGLTYTICGQPYSVITLLTLSTGTAPVAILQLDLSGHLNLITYAGTTGTSHTVYSGSDLRCGAYFQVDLCLTTTTWLVNVNGGVTATASGTVSAMTSAWTWLTVNGDYGTGGGSGGAIQHGGNMSASGIIVFPQVLPAWRLLAHYAAAITGFGLLPAPQSVAIQASGTAWTPDGSTSAGSYGHPGGTTLSVYGFSAVAASQAGSYSSGPSARASEAGIGTESGGVYSGEWVWVSWAALAPQVTIYTASAAGGESGAAVALGTGDAFSAGYGSGATGSGVCQVSGGSGASAPTAASALGDMVAQRIERILSYGGGYPSRAIDASATQPVQAALDIAGQAEGANIQAMASTDYGMLAVDNNNTLFYRSRPHLAADTVVWDLSTAGPSYGIPFEAGQEFPNDPQFITNVIQIAPYSPDGATPPVITPANAPAANASQMQYGPRPLSAGTTSYYQSTAEIQLAANWLLSTYGSLGRRTQNLTVDAAGNPAAWVYVAGCNVGDVIQITDLPLQGGPLSVGTYRISNMSKKVSGGANGGQPSASVTITADPVPSSYFT
jgi:hypothetical protein